MVIASVIIALVLFLAYWIVGGAILASVSAIRNMRIHKAQFGCLFSLSALILAIGATYSGFSFAEEQIATCVADAANLTDSVAGFIGCSVLSISITGIAGFLLHLFIGLVFLLLSRSFNQSFSDEESLEDDTELEFSFENM